jgi:HEAT repeat protein
MEFEDIEAAIHFLGANLSLNEAPPGFPDVAEYLGLSRDRRALAPLMAALEHGGDFIRATAAHGLGTLGYSDAIPLLIDRFQYDQGKYVRCDAALALGALQALEAVPILEQQFESEIFEVRKRIIWALGRFASPEARAALERIRGLLTKMACSADTPVDAAVIFMLGQICERLQ